MSAAENRVAVVVLASILAVTAIVYWPSLNGPYVLDDEVNITNNEALAITELNLSSMATAMSGTLSSPTGRPLAVLSFALNYYVAGSFEPTLPFKFVNLFVHLLNIVLVFFLATRLARSPALTDASRPTVPIITGLLCAALWGLHPINISNVLYVVQRMNSLAAMFVIAGLLAFVHGRMLLAQNRKKALAFMYGGVISGTALGITAKENALLLPLFALIIELTLFNTRETGTRRPLVVFFSLVLAVPMIGGLAYLFIHPDFFLDAYNYKKFTPSERLLTEARVLWYYVYLLIAPSAHELGLFHDDIAISTSVLNPPATSIALAGWIAALGACAMARRIPLVAFSIAWYLAGHILESTIIGLEIAFEHRNYLPGVGIIFSLSNGMARWMTAPVPRQRIAASVLGVMAIAIVAFSNRIVSENWKDLESLAAQTVRNHPNSPRANDFAVAVSANIGDLATARYHALRVIRLAPNEAGHHINLHLVNAPMNSRNAIDPRTLTIDCNDLDLSWPEVLLPCFATPATEVEQLLRRETITTATVAALVNLRICIGDKVSGCDALIPAARRWFATTTENPRIYRPALETTAYNAALLHAHVRDYVTAIMYLRKAADVAPDKPAYRVGEAEFLIHLGRLDEAERLLEQFSSHYGMYSTIALARNAPAIDRLRETLDAAKAARRSKYR